MAKQATSDDELVTVAFRLPKALARRLKIASATEDKTQQELATVALETYLSKLKY